MFSERWVKVSRNKPKREFVYPIEISWSGFYPDTGRELRFIRLSDGRFITDENSSYNYWEKRIKTSR